jgi:hypothetical protein
MGRTVIRNAAAAYMRATRERERIADTPAELAALAADCSAFLSGPGAVTLSPSQARALRTIRDRCARKAAAPVAA